MKNLTKIFMAVVAGMFAFSCVTDTTEDLGVKIEGQKGVTELAVSLEASRTHLGEKAEGLYPLYWSEGDAISVNGVTSTPLTAEQAGEASAIFSFGGDLELPYCVVYPAPEAVAIEDEVTEEPTPEPEPEPTPEPELPQDTYPVTFANVQPYTVGTFAPQTAPMYGYLAEAGKIEMQHLTGVLRLAIKGNGEKVTSIVVKAHEGKIAGTFLINCKTGTLTAHEEALNTVTVTFAEPLVLGAEAAPVYIAVPAGSHGTFLVTINTEAHEKMTVKFNSDVKPINAGSVREFSEFVYQANTADTEDSDFIIDSEEALIEFARIAGTFYPRTKAIVTADLDMSEYNWTPIEGFGAYEFDGGEFAIKGLNAPLFGATAATIKNLELVDVNYTITDLAKSGAIACELHNGSLEKCKASGAITINNTTLAEASDNYDGICHGGLVGYASGVAVTDCINNIDITATSFCEASKTIKSTVGGLVGCVANGCSLNNLTNNGDLTYVGTTHKGNLFISGIVGKDSNVGNADLTDMVSLSNCTNSGLVSSAKGSATTGNIYLAGITGCVAVAVDTTCNLLVNNAAITHNGSSNYAAIGGIASYDSTGSFTNCSNSAALSVADGSVVKGNTNVCGLFAGKVTTGGMNECHNTGALTISADGKTVSTGRVVLAGLGDTVTAISGTLPEIKNCTNSAAIKLLGQWSNTTEDGNGGRVLVGGLFHSINAGKISKCYNQATGTISITTGQMAALHMVGGLSAYFSAVTGNPTIYIEDCENKADISVNSTATVGNAEIGGLSGEPYLNNKGVEESSLALNFTRCKNSGHITVSATYSSNPQVGGLIGINNYDIINLTTCENSGNVTFNGSAPNAHLGGLVGYDGSNFAFTIDGCTNKGDVKCTSVITTGARIGGIVGTYNKDYQSATTVKNSTNLGTIALEGEQTSSSAAYNFCLGGILGYCYDTLFKIENCTNGSATDATKGVVTAGTAPSGIGVGGICGISTQAITISGCTNYGHISQTGKGGYNTVYRPHIAGVIGQCAQFLTVTNCTNYGTVEYGKVQASNKADVAGIVGETSSKGGLIENCKNGGTIKITAPTNAETNLAGIIGMAQEGTTVTKCQNLATAVISYEGEHKGAAMCVGGIAGSTNATTVKLLYCYNYGTVQQTRTTNTAGNLYIGGINGYPYIVGLIQYCGNHGAVITTSASKIFVGGIGGYPRTGTTGNDIKDCYNAYDLTFGGNAATEYYAGGIIGWYGKNKDAVPTLDNLLNLGRLTFVNPGPSKTYYGGIAGGTTNGVITNSNCYCDIVAVDKEGKVGMIMGITYAAATKATNCKIGGNMIFSQDVNTESTFDPEKGDYVDVTTTTDIKTPIDASNYLNYIYTSAITEDQATTDGCGWLSESEKPAIPVYTPAQ